MQVLFQLNDLNHDVDLFFLHCCHVDFLTSSCLFQASIFPYSIIQENQGTYSTQREKKGGWPNSCDGEVKLSRVVMLEYSCDGGVE